jgi:hypothetical protein
MPVMCASCSKFGSFCLVLLSQDIGGSPLTGGERGERDSRHTASLSHCQPQGGVQRDTAARAQHHITSIITYILLQHLWWGPLSLSWKWVTPQPPPPPHPHPHPYLRPPTWLSVCCGLWVCVTADSWRHTPHNLSVTDFLLSTWIGIGTSLVSSLCGTSLAAVPLDLEPVWHHRRCRPYVSSDMKPLEVCIINNIVTLTLTVIFFSKISLCLFS